MTRSVAADLDSMIASTRALERSIADLTDEQVLEPSLLPDWTRGHVLTHLARNADALLNLITWARTGVETLMYPSREKRSADIEAGPAPRHELVADVAAAHDRLVAGMAELSQEQWEHRIHWGAADRSAPVNVVPALRRVEVEIHHVDLDLDYTLAHLPSDFVLRMLASRPGVGERDDIDGFVLVGNDNEGPGRSVAAARRSPELPRRFSAGCWAGRRASGCSARNRCRGMSHRDGVPGKVKPGAPAVRELPDLIITKASVGPMDNNAYLLVVSYRRAGLDRRGQRVRRCWS